MFSLETVLALVTGGLLYWFPIRRWYMRWGASDLDLARPMAGDAAVSNPTYATTLAVTVAARPEHVWPWLVQMGYRRGGLYSYDWLDRLFGFLDAPSAERIIPEYQDLEAGDVIPIGRGLGFPVAAIEPRRTLVLGREADGVRWSWELALYPLDDRRTRLVSRNRVNVPASVGSALFMCVIEPAAFIMTRKMLLGLKRRAETLAGGGRESVTFYRPVRGSRLEQARALPGDPLIPRPMGSVTHAVTIARPPQDVWPWLAQMGAGRAGWYSYDSIDNGRQPSAERIVPELQRVVVGALFPALPGATDGFVVAEAELDHCLVLTWPLPDGRYLTTWAFVLEAVGPDCTRLLVRSRASADYSFGTVLRGVLGIDLPEWLVRPVVLCGHFIMQRRQLLGIARRAEHAPGQSSRAPTRPVAA